MFSDYKLTEMEQKVESLYKEKSIVTPSDLDIHNVAEMFNVKLDFSTNGPQRAIWDDEFSVIFLDPDQAEEKKREIFFHELGHPYLHSGNQTKNMNKNFREMQEAQANQFQLYAAIPFFMLNSLDLPRFEYQIVEFIQRTFKVPESLAKKRLEQIKRRILQSKIDKSSNHYQVVSEKKEKYCSMDNYPLLEDLFSENEIKKYFPKTSKSTNKVYFDYYNGTPIPLWYCIVINRGDVNWGKDFKLFPIDGNFEFINIKEMENKDSDAHVIDLFLHPSFPNDFAINLKVLKKQLMFFDVDPYNIDRLIINANQLVKLLEINIFGDYLNHLSKKLIANN